MGICDAKGVVEMTKINLTFPDGSVKIVEKGISAADVIKNEIGEGLYRAAIAVKLDDTTTDLTTPVTKDAKFTVLTFKNDEGKEIFRHSAAHVLALAVKRIFPKAKLTIGPAVEDGFYYDFDVETPFSEEDLNKIEQEMKKIVKENLKFERLDVSKDDAKKHMKGNKYKLEMIDDLGDEQITIYKNEDFSDLCRGPHVEHTGKIKAVKLTKLAGAYWRGDAKNKQLQRIYGVAFPNKDELKDYLKILEEAERRNHVKLGKQMDLFSLNPEGPGFPFWHHNGLILKNQLIEYWREEHRKDGYLEIETPIALSKTLWETSGHWDLYKENMYTTKVDGEDYAIKPMNCPGGMLVYKQTMHSYRELPLRVGELGLVHRHELSGVLNGLFRVRMFTQDDAHIFCSENQLKDEIKRIVGLIQRMLSTFGFSDYEFTLSVRSAKKKDKYLGTDAGWDAAEGAIKAAFKELKLPFVVEEGEAKFYGPSLDVQIKDALKRKWQCSTIQVDFNLADRFDITYEGKDGQKHKPFILHRVVYGSLERFIGILIEHYAGKFPLWLSPVQVKLLPIADRHIGYCKKVKGQMEKSNIRVEIDDKPLTTNKKVRNAQLEQVPYILVVGDKEETNGTVNVRTRDNEVHGEKKVDVLVGELVKEVNARKQ
jgi:threonyl-tRNA synthetase